MKYALNKLFENDFQQIPDKPGIYWYEIDKPIKKPKFKTDNPAWHYRGRDPTVSTDVLEEKWVKGATILYIGRSINIHKRIKDRYEFSKGRRARVWGGRYLWQLGDSIQNKIILRFKVVQDYKKAEEDEISDFRDKNGGRLPFANLR